ncbi:hypothetical protein M0R45_009523 [Rubus argutus]|uniref:Uncharacterized protein n=1 Tax=Rubus argutus TaxID=59490 RepID=A0AAW1Y6S8_RUBAR
MWKHDVGFGRLLGRKSLEPLPLVLPSLRAFCSLVDLDLSDHNLCEGDIIDDIGCLSSLEQLDLSGNNFITLPTAFNAFLSFGIPQEVILSSYAMGDYWDIFNNEQGILELSFHFVKNLVLV